MPNELTSKARRDAEDAIRYAHLSMEIVSLLTVDLLARGRLSPTTKSKIADAVREAEMDRLPSHHAIERLRTALKEEAPLERELKRERPGES